GVGSFSLNEAKKVEFITQDELETLSGKLGYEHVVREIYSHDVLTGDKLQSSDDLHQYFVDQRKGQAWQRWKIASVFLISIAATSIVIRFFLGSFSFLDARYDPVHAKHAISTYTLQK
ncbi:MAG: hypothetical protein RLZZ49_720, partial [Bacteroidota bacterium]